MIIKIPYSIDDFIVKTRIKNDVLMYGNISFSTSLRLECKLKGDVYSEEGFLIISETCEVYGNLNASTIMISGKVFGNISATKKVEIFKGAVIIGNIRAPRFRMENDVEFEGECEILGENKREDAKV